MLRLYSVNDKRGWAGQRAYPCAPTNVYGQKVENPLLKAILRTASRGQL
jgi:hypothetical protein